MHGLEMRLGAFDGIQAGSERDGEIIFPAAEVVPEARGEDRLVQKNVEGTNAERAAGRVGFHEPLGDFQRETAIGGTRDEVGTLDMPSAKTVNDRVSRESSQRRSAGVEEGFQSLAGRGEGGRDAGGSASGDDHIVVVFKLGWVGGFQGG